MRANRLFSLIFLLQAHGRQTAAALAQALNVSERTIFRDINVLSSSGIPVYAEHGPGGGFALLDGFQSSLTELTEDELNSLFVLAVPGLLADLQSSRDLQSALRKISAKSGGRVRQSAALLQSRIHLDTRGWGSDEQTPFLQLLETALRENCKVMILQKLRFDASTERVVEPLGLVAKEGGWNLVFQDQDRLDVLCLADVLHIDLLQERFPRPKTFDLIRFWDAWCAQEDRERAVYRVHVRIAPDLLGYLPVLFPQAVRQSSSQDDADPKGWERYVLEFDHLEAARAEILPLGKAVEVLYPEPLRRSIVDYADQILRHYAGSSPDLS
jgi:predicted DNA-binding transcriptional regulator YafY